MFCLFFSEIAVVRDFCTILYNFRCLDTAIWRYLLLRAWNGVSWSVSVLRCTGWSHQRAKICVFAKFFNVSCARRYSGGKHFPSAVTFFSGRKQARKRVSRGWSLRAESPFDPWRNCNNIDLTNLNWKLYIFVHFVQFGKSLVKRNP